ncbi:MAG: ERCC4 domain-containing protein [Candidatus Heimdallarchaeaceae archaeon]
MKLIIDGRETKLYGNIWTVMKFEKNLPYIQIEKESISLDAILFDEDFTIAFERKERNDFTSSIIDNRIINQAIEMQNYDERYMILEGNIFSTYSNILPQAIAGMLCSLTYNYNIKLIPSPNSRMTAYIILNLIKRRNKKYIPIRRISKISDNILATMLTVIPGISFKRAETIVEDFDINSLKDFSKLTEENFRRLKEEKKLKGIGDILFKNILEVA